LPEWPEEKKNRYSRSEKGFGVWAAEHSGTRARRARQSWWSYKGKKELRSIMPKMKEVFQLMTAELSLNEKLYAIGFLKQMNDFHSGIGKNT